jgi:N-acetylmuramoyl-L-alanine amidase
MRYFACACALIFPEPKRAGIKNSGAKIIMMKTLVLNSILFLSTSLVFGSDFNFPLTTTPNADKTSFTFRDGNFEITFDTKKKVSNDYKIKTVVIDAGHGGRDGGCSGKNSREKEIALAVAKKLRDKMNDHYPTVKVIMTREKDVFIPLHKRASIANKNNADLFISIHCNYIVGASHIHGSETYVLGLHRVEANLDVAKRENEVIFLEEDYEKNYPVDPNSTAGHIILSAYQLAHLEQSIFFAECVEKHIDTQPGHRSRGVRQAGFHVLRETTMPSVLVETGYLSNANDEAFLLSDAGQEKIAKSIFQAFKDYKTKVETFTPSDEPLLAEVGKPAGSLASAGDAGKSSITIEKTETAEESPAAPSAKVSKEKPQVVAVSSDIKPTKAPVTTTTAPEIIEFRVQLAASKTQLGVNHSMWNQVGHKVTEIREGDYFKYQIGGFTNYDAAIYTAGMLKKNGAFKDCFIVAYQGPEKLNVVEARKKASR